MSDMLQHLASPGAAVAVVVSALCSQMGLRARWADCSRLTSLLHDVGIASRNTQQHTQDVDVDHRCQGCASMAYTKSTVCLVVT